MHLHKLVDIYCLYSFEDQIPHRIGIHLGQRKCLGFKDNEVKNGYKVNPELKRIGQASETETEQHAATHSNITHTIDAWLIAYWFATQARLIVTIKTFAHIWSHATAMIAMFTAIWSASTCKNNIENE